MNKKHQDLLNKAFKYLPGGHLGNINLSRNDAIIIEKANGSKVWDTEGKEYIDFLMGSGPMILGHNHPTVRQNVQDSINQGSHFFITNKHAILLAEEINKAMPCAEKIRFTTSGTDANFQAMRLARTFTKKEKILKFEGGFHGTSDYAMMSMAPNKNALKNFPISTPTVPGIPTSINETMLIAPFNNIDITESIITKYKDELAAIIIEPLQRILPPENNFLEKLRKITNKHNILLIFDEVVTGFRLAYGGAQEKYKTIPDLAAIGKIMAGGYPLAAVCGRKDLMDLFVPSETNQHYVNQQGTLNGMPVACVAGLATLNELKKPNTYKKLETTGKKLMEGIKSIFEHHNIPIQICGEPTIFDIAFTSEKISDYRSYISSNKNLMDKFNLLLLKNGILKSMPFKFYPSLAHTDEDINKTLEIINEIAPQLS